MYVTNKSFFDELNKSAGFAGLTFKLLRRISGKKSARVLAKSKPVQIMKKFDRFIERQAKHRKGLTWLEKTQLQTAGKTKNTAAAKDVLRSVSKLKEKHRKSESLISSLANPVHWWGEANRNLQLLVRSKSKGGGVGTILKSDFTRLNMKKSKGKPQLRGSDINVHNNLKPENLGVRLDKLENIGKITEKGISGGTRAKRIMDRAVTPARALFSTGGIGAVGWGAMNLNNPKRALRDTAGFALAPGASIGVPLVTDLAKASKKLYNKSKVNKVNKINKVNTINYS